MAFYDLVWYANAGDQSTTGHYAVAKRPQNAAVTAGQLVRQFTAPAVGSERVFICVVAGTTANTTDATWTLTRGAKSTDGTATWQEVTGIAAVNGDAPNTVNWTAAKAIGVPTLGATIQRNNGASYWICTTAGTMGASEPAWPNDTAGTTQADGTTTWTCLGVVGNFTGGQAPHARVQNACTNTWFAAGNTIYVGDNHAESQTTAITVAPSLNSTTVGRIVCHNHSGSYPPASSDLRTSATISTTSNTNLTFNPSNGAIYVYGVTFIAGAGITSSSAQVIVTPNNAYHYFDNCSFKVAGTGGSQSFIVLTSGVGVIIWNNCTVGFGATQDYIDLGTDVFIWQNTGPILASGSVVPTGLMAPSASGRLTSIVLEALDLSQLTGAIDKQISPFEMGNWLIKDCKLNASMTIPTPQAYGQTVQLVRSDSGGASYKSARYQYEGTETTETSITRVGGASDPTGQAQSRKIVTTANSQWLRPFKAEPYAIWNPTTGANVTVTVCGTVNAGALPNNDDIWLEVEYLGSSASPLGTIVTTTKANVLAANAAVASDGSTWNNTATVYPTWEASSVTAVTLSGGNLVATNTGTTSADQGAKVASAFGLSSGKYYFEITWTTRTGGANEAVGIGTYASTYIGMGNTGGVTGTIAYFLGSVWSGGSNLASLSGWGAGQIMGVAVDLDNRKFWIRMSPSGVWNGDVGGSYNPATNVGGLLIPAGTMVPFVTFGGGSGAANNVVTANFGASAFTGAVPSGFTPGWTASLFTPFKLTATLSSPQPGMAGYLHARVRAAKPSSTFYIDPMVVLS